MKWNTKEQEELNQSVIRSVLLLGMAFGALIGGRLIRYGRRRA